MLNISTPYGNHYKVTEKGEIVRTDMSFEPSGQWLMQGLSHVKRNYFIPFNLLTPEFLEGLTILWKTANPQWTVRDLDHGSTREWGNTKWHGIKNIWFD